LTRMWAINISLIIDIVAFKC